MVGIRLLSLNKSYRAIPMDILKCCRYLFMLRILELEKICYVAPHLRTLRKVATKADHPPTVLLILRTSFTSDVSYSFPMYNILKALLSIFFISRIHVSCFQLLQ